MPQNNILKINSRKNKIHLIRRDHPGPQIDILALGVGQLVLDYLNLVEEDEFTQKGFDQGPLPDGPVGAGLPPHATTQPLVQDVPGLVEPDRVEGVIGDEVARGVVEAVRGDGSRVEEFGRARLG